MEQKRVVPFDMLSVPWLFGLYYFFLFGLAVIDTLFDASCLSDRARDVFIDWHGLSPMALAYLWLGLCLFVLGYSLSAGVRISSLIHKTFPVISRRTSFVSQNRFFVWLLILFSISFQQIISFVQQYGAGRVVGPEQFDPGFSYQNVAGQIAFIVYALGIWRFMLARRSSAGKVSPWFTLFVWGCMFALEIAFAMWLNSRMHLIRVLLVAILAYHYGYSRIRTRFVVLGAIVCIVVVMPLLTLQREDTGALGTTPDSISSIMGWGWNSVMGHFSSLESFSVTFDNLAWAPQPDPLWIILTSPIPRALWPDKPLSTWGFQFGYWVTGYPTDAFLPTLPGELLLHFGYVEALLTLAVLGIGWRTIYSFFIASEQSPPGLGFIYIVLVAVAIPQIEVGFVGPYSMLLTNMIVGLILFFPVTKEGSQALGK